MCLHPCNLSCTHFQNCPDSIRHFLLSTRPPDTWKALHKTRHIKKKIKWRVVLCMADSGSRYHVPKLKMLYFEREKGHLCRHWNKDYSHIHAHTTFSFFPSYICSNPTWKTLSLPEGGSTKERSPEVQLNANVGELKTYRAWNFLLFPPRFESTQRSGDALDT